MSFPISVIVPSFNQGQYIEQTISSMTSISTEVLVFDGKSTDQTTTILRRLDDQLAHWISEPDQGQSHAINKGLNKATGKIINWINSDDYLEPGALEAIESAFKDEAVNVFIGKSNIVKDGKIVAQSRGTDIYKGNLAKTIGRARIDQPETWWRKSVIDEIGPLNQALHYTMDRDWWIKYLLRFGMSGIKKENVVLANFRLHGESKTVSQSDAFKVERNSYYRSLAKEYGLVSQAKELSGIADFLPLTNMPAQVDLQLLRKAFSYFYLLLADEAYVKGDHRSVRYFLDTLDKKILSTDDYAFYDKLAFRSKLPSTLIKLARKIKP
ncbi:MAG: glycosyltransferase [Flavobacteriales bacterium]|nr:glycosyltransferase [Flavobacteriales bacterium]